jgi:tetratricopeptide (TPR) repeat protein
MYRLRRRFAQLCLGFLPLALALAQHQPPAPENPVVLYKGLGTWHHPIHTSSAEAQKFFDQGLALTYGFNRYEALRSFRKAAELDPEAAMPYWGMAMAQGPYINMDGDQEFSMKASCAAAEAGLKIGGTPGGERAYLEAAAKRCPAFRARPYIEAMRELAKRLPDDLDAQTLYAESLLIPVRWHWYDADGTPSAGVLEAERVLEQVLRRWPDHPGANHLYIHAVESSLTPERAIPSAQRLMGVMPSAGHMVHMPGHIWLLLGDYELAAAVNERAVAVDREYLAQSHTSSGYGSYYLHNLHFVAYARWMEGRKADGLRAADELAAGLAPMLETMPGMADMFNAICVFGRVRFRDWDGILSLPQPKDSLHATIATWRYARALAFAGRGDHAAAVREQSALEAMRVTLPAHVRWGLNNKLADVLATASEIVAARLAPSPAEAVPHWQHAVAMQDALVYDEPPAWYYPLRESLGAALLLDGKAAEAEGIFREGIKRSPRNGRMLFGLMESLRAQRKTQDAESVKREFDAAWSKADVTLRVEDL